MKRKFSIRHDLGMQILTLYVLFVAPIVLAAIVFDYFTSRRLETEIKANDLALARAIAQETDINLQNSLQAVRELAQYPAVLDADPAGMQVAFDTVLDARPDMNLVYRLDANGIMLFHSPIGPGSTVGTDFSFRDYFQAAQASRDPLVSKGRISPTTDQPVTTVVMPLRDSAGNFLGLVGANLKLQSLSHTLGSITAQFPDSEQFQIMIIDSTGQVIAHSDPAKLLEDMNQVLPTAIAALGQRQSGNQVTTVGNTETLLSYVPVFSANWGVIVQLPTAVAFATPRSVHKGVMITMGVFLLIGLLFWTALATRVIRPLEELSAFSQQIGLDEELSSDLSQSLQRLAKRPDQMGRLIHSLTRMEQAIQARLNELTSLLETSAIVVSSLDLHTVLDRILEQAEHLLGAPKIAIVALDEKQGVFRAQASRGLSERYATQLSIHPSEPLSVTLRALRSGEPIQISDTETDPTFTAMRPRSRSEGYRAMLAVPLKTQHAPPSALLVYYSEPHEFTQQEINLATQFANQAAMAIENATLYARSDMQLQEQTRRLEALILSLSDGLILEDLQGRVRYANRQMGLLAGMEHTEMVDQPAEKLIDRISQQASIQPDYRQAIHAALEGLGRRQVEIKINTNRRVRYLQLQVFGVTDDRRVPIGRGQIWRDVTGDRELDELKSNLIATVSHELRTPLAAIKGYATTLLAEDVAWDEVSQREFLTIISNETDRLSRLVTDLLDLSRIEAGSLQMSRTPTDLSELVTRAGRLVLGEDYQRLERKIPSDLPTLWIDRQRIEVVLRNLIENAAKYSPPAAPIVVSAKIVEEQLLVTVSDQGPGIPPAHRDRIFDSFYRVDGRLSRAVPGAGLGLAICKGFVHAHGGQIWLEAAPIGTAVTFSLPFGELEEPEQAGIAERAALDIEETTPG
jgi:PAS domain S-box-containing protein